MSNHQQLSLMDVLEHNDEIIQQIQFDQLVQKLKAEAIAHKYEAELNQLCETIVPHNSPCSPSLTCSPEFQNLLSEFTYENAELKDCCAVDTNDDVCYYNHLNLSGCTIWDSFSHDAIDDKFTQFQKYPSLSKHGLTMYPFREPEREEIELEKLNTREALFTVQRKRAQRKRAQRKRSDAFDKTPLKKQRVAFM